MTLFGKIREYSARRAMQRKLFAEMNQITDAELMDLDLSRTKLMSMSRRQALAG